MDPVSAAVGALAVSSKSEEKKEGKEDKKEGALQSLVKPLLAPAAEVAGQELGLLVKEGFQRLKEARRRRNIRIYFERLESGPKAKKPVDPNVEDIDALDEALEGAQDVDPDSETGAIWQELLRRITSGEANQRQLVAKLKELSETEVSTLLRHRRDLKFPPFVNTVRSALRLRSDAEYAEGCVALERQGILRRSYALTALCLSGLVLFGTSIQGSEHARNNGLPVGLTIALACMILYCISVNFQLATYNLTSIGRRIVKSAPARRNTDGLRA